MQIWTTANHIHMKLSLSFSYCYEEIARIAKDQMHTISNPNNYTSGAPEHTSKHNKWIIYSWNWFLLMDFLHLTPTLCFLFTHWLVYTITLTLGSLYSIRAYEWKWWESTPMEKSNRQSIKLKCTICKLTFVKMIRTVEQLLIEVNKRFGIEIEATMKSHIQLMDILKASVGNQGIFHLSKTSDDQFNNRFSSWFNSSNYFT